MPQTCKANDKSQHSQPQPPGNNNAEASFTMIMDGCNGCSRGMGRDTYQLMGQPARSFTEFTFRTSPIPYFLME
ncbi:unnamed protein product [Cercopithifilaria johnstoni]|uniref:Uncharacterized protein n=1 Tax=Cercopithifilaria johnstoni TaxID=2874296 RepID=A0A8J2MTK3_9BILA|nr:unnamed protein product [Cercopithifilaria johnstoni]